tara:strand:- start:367 stop:651 length:285 start_codon:yes stop_codon:yes gene_type:complete
MIESITAGYALVLIVIIFIIQIYIESVLWQIFKELDIKKKPHWFYAQIKYLKERYHELPNHIQGKVDEILTCQMIIGGLIGLCIILYLMGNFYK